MPMTDAMLLWFAKAMVGETQNAFDNTHAYIGVGDSNAAFDSTQIDLQAVTNHLRKGMDAGYPSRTCPAAATSETGAGSLDGR